MSAFKRLWTRITRFAEAIDGFDDPTGDYILSLGKRVDELGRRVEHLERRMHSSLGDGIQQ